MLRQDFRKQGVALVQYAYGRSPRLQKFWLENFYLFIMKSIPTREEVFVWPGELLGSSM